MVTYSVAYVNSDASRRKEPIIVAVVEIDGASPLMGILHILGEVEPDEGHDWDAGAGGLEGGRREGGRDYGHQVLPPEEEGGLDAHQREDRLRRGGSPVGGQHPIALRVHRRCGGREIPPRAEGREDPRWLLLELQGGFAAATHLLREVLRRDQTVHSVRPIGRVAAMTRTLIGQDGARLEQQVTFAYVTFDGVAGGILHRVIGRARVGSRVKPRFRKRGDRKGSILDLEGFERGAARAHKIERSPETMLPDLDEFAPSSWRWRFKVAGRDEQEGARVAVPQVRATILQVAILARSRPVRSLNRSSWAQRAILDDEDHLRLGAELVVLKLDELIDTLRPTR